MSDTTQFSEYIEYVGAEEYDLENGLDGPELPFYLELARETGGPVLDLACGTGFLTIPMATLGLSATGVLSIGALALVIAFLPGLGGYWTWSNTLSILQQYVIMRRHGHRPDVFGNILSGFRRGPATANSDKPPGAK